MRLGLIVEGHGETEALPVLVRRIAAAAGNVALDIPPPLRVPKGKMTKPGEIGRAVELMARKTAPDGALLIVLDADDDCPAHLGPEILRLARAARSDRPLAVAVAVREFETWFLAAAGSLAGKRGLPPDLVAPEHPEAIGGAKGWLAARMPHGYAETVDQAKFAAEFDWQAAQRLPSFARFVRELRRLVAAGPPAA